MNETYERLLRRIDTAQIDKVRRVMNLLCYSSRPLTTKEVCHALAVNLQKPPHLDLENLVDSEDKLCRICENLIDITRKKSLGNFDVSVITISHSLLRQYLESERIRQQDVAAFAINRKSANRELAEICLVYLQSALSGETRGLEKVYKFPFVPFAAMEWFYYYLACRDKESGLQDLALQLFNDEDSGYFTAWVELYNVDDAWGSFPNLNQPMTVRGSPLYYASILGLEDIVDKIASTASDVNFQGGRYGNALQAASLKGHRAVVQLLLEHGADVNKRNGAYGTALQAASLKGHTEVVNLLLRYGADPNIQSGKFATALQAASSVGNKKIVQILLDHKADADAHSGADDSALQVATRKGHEEVKKLLLDAGAHPSPTALIEDLTMATIYGDLQKMKDILNTCKDHPDDRFQVSKDRALLVASNICYEGAVNLLLENGANVNAQHSTMGSALYAASLTQRESSQELLYDFFMSLDLKGTINQRLTEVGALDSWLVDMTLRDESNREGVLEKLSALAFNSPSMRSSYRFLFPSPEDSEKVVKILLTKGANINAQGGKYGNALQAASYIGNDRVVKLLLEEGADVNCQGGFYRSAINAASAGSHSGVMQILRDHQVNIARNNVDRPNILSSEMNGRL